MKFKIDRYPTVKGTRWGSIGLVLKGTRWSRIEPELKLFRLISLTKEYVMESSWSGFRNSFILDGKVEHGDWVVIVILTFRFYSSNRLQNK